MGWKLFWNLADRKNNWNIFFCIWPLFIQKESLSFLFWVNGVHKDSFCACHWIRNYLGLKEHQPHFLLCTTCKCKSVVVFYILATVISNPMRNSEDIALTHKWRKKSESFFPCFGIGKLYFSSLSQWRCGKLAIGYLTEQQMPASEGKSDSLRRVQAEILCCRLQSVRVCVIFFSIYSLADLLKYLNRYFVSLF